MAKATVRGPRISHGDFEILADESPLLNQRYPPIFAYPQSDHGSDALEELPLDYQTPNYPQSKIPQKVKDSCPSTAAHLESNLPLRPMRRRPPIGTQTFTPLVEVQEEPSHLEWERSLCSPVDTLAPRPAPDSGTTQGTLRSLCYCRPD